MAIDRKTLTIEHSCDKRGKKATTTAVIAITRTTIQGKEVTNQKNSKGSKVSKKDGRCHRRRGSTCGEECGERTLRSFTSKDHTFTVK
jgi:hypothetical protein